MPLQTVQSLPLEHPEIPFDTIRFDLNVAHGRISARLHRCRVLPEEVWQDMPGQTSKALDNPPELVACLPTLNQAVAEIMSTGDPYILNVKSHIAADGNLCAMANIVIPATRQSKVIPNLYADTSTHQIQTVLPLVMQAVAAVNARLQLL